MKFEYQPPGGEIVVREGPSSELAVLRANCWNCGAPSAPTTSERVHDHGVTITCQACAATVRVTFGQVWKLHTKNGVMYARAALRGRPGGLGDDENDDGPTPVKLRSGEMLCGNCYAPAEWCVRGNECFEVSCNDCGCLFETPEIWGEIGPEPKPEDVTDHLDMGPGDGI